MRCIRNMFSSACGVTFVAAAMSAGEMSVCALSSMNAIARRNSTGVLSCRSSMVGSAMAVLGNVVSMVAARYRASAPANRGCCADDELITVWRTWSTT